MSGCKCSVWKILSAVAALMLMLPRLVLGEVGVCPPYSKTYGPDDPPDQILAFIEEINLRPGGGTLILEPGDYGDLGGISVTGVVCLQGRPGSSERVVLDAQLAIEPGAQLTLRSVSRGSWESRRPEGLAVAVHPDGVLWSDRCELRSLLNEGAAFLSGVSFGGGWAFGKASITNTGLLFMNRGRLSTPGAWGLWNEGGHALLQQVSIVQNGYSDQFDADGGGISNTGVVQLVGSTVSRNDGNGGIRGNGVVEIIGSIVGDNYLWHYFYGNPDCNGPVTDLGYNVFGPDGGCTVTDSTSTAAYPMFAFPDLGDPSWNPELGAGSPAIDLIPLELCAETDGLGRARTDGNGDGVVACDAGALEYGYAGVEAKVRARPYYWKKVGEIDLSASDIITIYVFSTETFDATQIVFDTVVIEGFGYARDARGWPWTIDVDRDGLQDYQATWRQSRMEPLSCGYQEHEFSAMTEDGLEVRGLLKFEAVGCAP